ncbi:MAG: energy transducer TonB [Saprospiraceae bacterium]
MLLAFLLAALPNLMGQQYTQTDVSFAKAHIYEKSPGERVLKTWYHYVVARKGMKYVVRTFYPETGAVTGYFTYQDRGLKILDGPFGIYSDDGLGTTEGMYAENVLNGPWKTTTGDQILAEGVYDMGLRIGEWKEHYTNGQLKSLFTFDGGEELGPYVRYDTLGVVLDKGNSILGERYTSLPPAEFEARRGNDIIDEFPCFGDCNPNLSIGERTRMSGLAVSRYIQDSVRSPEIVALYGIEGRVNASVTIDVRGKVSDINIVNGLCQPIADECRRLINGMPDWRPGSKNGKPAEVKVLIPFAFAP